MTLRLGELCAGYNGLGMAVEEVFGATPAWFSEYDTAPSKILAHHYPDVPNYGDMTAIDWANIEHADIISGGTPCQDLSAAGKRKGMTEGTRSNLWVQMREAIAIQKPKYVVWENVRGAYSASADSDLEQCPGCVGDPADGGAVLRALGRVLGDLSDLGYDCQWRGLRAADVGAPHGRYRVFILAAHRDGLRSHRSGQRTSEDRRGQSTDRRDATPQPKSIRGREGRTEHARLQGRLDAIQRSTPPLANPNRGDDARRQQGQEWGEKRGTASEWSSGSHIDWGQYEPAIRRWEALRGTAPAPTELTTRGTHRLSARFAEWLMGVPAGWITDVPGLSRNDQLKACGNGVVPAQAIAALRDMLAAFEMEKAA